MKRSGLHTDRRGKRVRGPSEEEGELSAEARDRRVSDRETTAVARDELAAARDLSASERESKAAARAADAASRDRRAEELEPDPTGSRASIDRRLAAADRRHSALDRRYGGDEFISAAGLDAARSHLTATQFLLATHDPPVFVTIGLAQTTPIDTVETMLVKADAELYRQRRDDRPHNP